jgi:hypothetical protein
VCSLHSVLHIIDVRLLFELITRHSSSSHFKLSWGARVFHPWLGGISLCLPILHYVQLSKQIVVHGCSEGPHTFPCGVFNESNDHAILQSSSCLLLSYGCLYYVSHIGTPIQYERVRCLRQRRRDGKKLAALTTSGPSLRGNIHPRRCFSLNCPVCTTVVWKINENFMVLLAA